MITIKVDPGTRVKETTPLEEIESIIELINTIQGDVQFITVSPIVVETWQRYGKEKLGLDVKFVSSGKEVSIEYLRNMFSAGEHYLDMICKV